MKAFNDAIDTLAGDILGGLGLQRRLTTADYLIPALGCFAAGAMVGGVAALLLTPYSGPELRERIGDQLAQANDRLQSAKERARDAAENVRERVARSTNKVNARAGEVSRSAGEI